MEYAKEGSLSDKISEHQIKGIPIDEDTILYFTAQIIIAVLFMHQKNILHRDIKTQNLFLTKENIVKLGDFGISKALGTYADLTKTLVGTPYFMSPEVCSGENYGQKADIWAIGCTLYEMVMLKRPFDNINLNILFNEIRTKEFPPLHDNTSADIRMLITFMLQKDPIVRPSVWDLSKIPSINKMIRKYYEEEALDDPFLKEHLFSGPKIREIRQHNTTEQADKKPQAEKHQQQTAQDSSTNSIEQTFKLLSESITPYDQKVSFFRVERNVINGKQIFDWINQYYSGRETQQIIEILNELLEKKYMHHVMGPLYESNPLSLYRFQYDVPNSAANQYKIWNKQARSGIIILEGLVETANEIIVEVTDQYLGKIHDEKLLASKKYLKFIDMLCELQKIYLQSVPLEEKKCFFINLMQVMYFHKYMRERYNKLRNDKKQKVSTLFETIKSFFPFLQGGQEQFYYIIGNHKLTLEDVKHGILRGNQKNQFSSFTPYGNSDSNKQLVIPQDLRVLMLFKEDNVIPTELKYIKLEHMEEQLNEVCTKFMSTYVYIDNVENDLTMHKIFQIYSTDFGSNPTDAIAWASKYTKNLGRADELIANITSGDVFVQYQDKFEV